MSRCRCATGCCSPPHIYLPNAPGPFPTLLIRTIYDNQWERYLAWAVPFIERGYAVAMQDCRGRHDSDGAWEPYIHETEDGYDTHEWLGAQPWCDGTIGMFGVSYLGFTQTLPATLRSRYLRALVPIAGQQDNFGHFYIDGALQLHIALNFINMAGRTMQWGTRRLMNSEQLYRRLPARLGAGRHRRPALLSAGHRALHVRRVLAEL